MEANILDRLTRLEEQVNELQEALARSQRRSIGVTIEEARRELENPVERGPEQMELLNQFFGSFSGPEDLSSRMREYINGERD
jgi:hypothetical protein